MSKLWLHTLCSNSGNYEHIARMTERYDLFDGIVAMVHIDDVNTDGVYNLLSERKGEGKILSGPFLKDFSLSRNLCFRQGIIKEGDFVLVLDCKEYVNPDFLIRLKNELIPLFEQNNVGVIYQLSKCVIFKYYRDVTYHLSVHTGLRGLRGNIIDLQQYEEYQDRKNWIWSERDNNLSWISGAKYFFFPDSNHVDLVYEAGRFPDNSNANLLIPQHRELRLRFFDYCREKLGFEANQDSMIEYMSSPDKWTNPFIEFLEVEKILKTFYRYYVLKEDYKIIFDTENNWSIKKHLNIPISFKINNLEFEYVRTGHNQPETNERTIEIPLLQWFVEKFKGDVTELGAVSPYYFKTDHKIVDLYDPHPKSIHLDAIDNMFMFDNTNFLSISIFEHLKKQPNAPIGEYDNPTLACKFIDYIVENAGNWLMTFPIGDNTVLDKHILAKDYSRIILRRKNKQNEWEIIDKNDINYKPNRTYSGAEAIFIITNQEELISD